MEELPLNAAMSHLIVNMRLGVDTCRSNSMEELLLLVPTPHPIFT